MAYNGVQIENSPNIIVITDSDANQITVTQPVTRTVEVAALGPQGPVGPQGPTGSMAESNSGSFSITGSLTVSGSSTFTNIGPAIFSGSVSISGSALYNGKEILTTAISGGFVTTSSFNSFTSSINSFTASYNTGSFTGSFTGVSNLTSLTSSNALVTGNVTVLGTASINTLIVNQTQLSTGSNQLGDAADDTQTLYGTVVIPTGSLTVSGSIVATGNSTVSGQLTVVGALNGGQYYPQTSAQMNNIYGGRSDFAASGISFNTLLPAQPVMVINYLGNVGIRTTTPSASLDIRGTQTATSSIARTILISSSLSASANNDNLIALDIQPSYNNGSFTGVSRTAVRFPNQTYFQSANTAGTYYNVFGVDINNFMNFGNASLNAVFAGNNLSFSGTAISFAGGGSATFMQVKASTSGNTAFGNYSFTLPDNGYRVQIYASNAVSGSLYISGSASQILTRIDSDVSSSILFISGSGNVGIGTNTPTYRLDVSGSSQFYKSSTDYIQLLQDPNTITFSPSVPAYLKYGSVTIMAMKSGLGNSTLLYGAGSSILSATQNGVNIRQNVDGAFATAMLQVRGSGSSSTTTALRVENSNASASLVIRDDGFVGIGTTTPGVQLDVVGSIRANSTMFSSTVQTNNIQTNGQNLTILGAGGTAGLTMNQTTRQFGIGTTTPSASLHISGSSGSVLLEVDSDSTQNILYVSGSGNIGVGTNTPLRRLHVDTSGSGITEIQLALTSTDAISRTGILFASSSLASGRQHKFLHRVNTPTAEWILNATAGQNAVWYFLPKDDTNFGLNIATPFNGGTTYLTTGLSQSLLSLGAGGITNQHINISASGNVGIATTSPQTKLHVGPLTGGDGTAQERLRLSGDWSTIGSGALLRFTNQHDLGTNPNAGEYNLAGIAGADDNGNWGGSLYFYTAPQGTPGGATLSTRMVISSQGFVGIGNTAPAARLHVKGAGSTSNSTGLLVENASSAPAFTVTDDLNARFYGNVGVRVTPSASFHVFGTTILSGSAGTGSALTVYKSGSTVMSIQGSQGELFSITDSLSGSLFSVSNISGLPILEVFSDNTVLLGSYLDPMLMTTQRVTANSGSTVIYSLPTASYDGVFVDYVIRSGSNARAGQFMGMWSGSSTNFTDNSTTDFGDTTGFIFGLIVSGSNMVLTGSASTSAWTVRAGIRSI